MNTVQTVTRVNDITGATEGRPEETLPTGESITRAIVMGAKSCCGAAYSESPHVMVAQPSFTVQPSN